MLAMPRLLTPDDAQAYTAIRRAMVLDSPPAFLGSPEHDEYADPAVIAKQLAGPESEILSIADPSDPTRLVATAGIVRAKRPKTRHGALLWGVYCHPHHRRKGLARAVAQAAIDTARQWSGVSVIRLTVTEAMPHAMALYKSLGFVRWGTEPDAVRVDGASFAEHHMTLNLEPRST